MKIVSLIKFINCIFFTLFTVNLIVQVFLTDETDAIRNEIIHLCFLCSSLIVVVLKVDEEV